MKLFYPSSHQLPRLNDTLLSIKIARYSSCSVCKSCNGLHPPPGVNVVSDELEAKSSLGDLTQYGSDDDDGTTYLQSCACGHTANEHNADPSDIDREEYSRRGRAAVRLDELLQDKGRFLDFGYSDEDIDSLRKQMHLPRSYSTPSVVPSSPEPSSTALPLLSPASSILSDPPQPPNKRRRISSSSLSEADDDDDDEDKPLAARTTMSSTVDRPEIPTRKVPAHRGGKKTSSMKSKGQIGLVSTPTRTGQDQSESTRNVNGINGHEAKVKLEDKLDENQLTRLATGVTVDAGGPTSPAQPVKAEKAAIVELRKGIIQISAVENDGAPRSLVILTGLKTLFQKQLPKMPREYIARLVYDENSKALAIIKRGYKVVGGICYRPFPHRGFAEIVFFATSSADQEKGYGGMLMDHFKTHIKRTYPEMMHFLTYADNYAVGYFWKQGFSKDITLDRSIWAGYIKDYEGGTIMQCTMLRKVDYLDKASIIAQQREAILTKIREMSKSHIVYTGLPQFQEGGSSDISVDPSDVPGLSESGWTPAAMTAPPARATPRSAEHHFMQRLLSDLQGHPQSWAFLKPVNGDEVLDYYEVIKRPMDFSTIEHKLHTDQYNSLDTFVNDVQLVFDNCRAFNLEGSIYFKNATRVEKYFRDELAERLNNEE